MKAEPASVGRPEPVFVSLSGVQGFCGYDFGSQIGRPNHGATLSSAYLTTLPLFVGGLAGSFGIFM